MAASIIGNFSFNFIPAAGGVQTLASGSITLTLTGSNFLAYSQTIPTTAGGTALNVAGLTTPRWIAVINRDPTNYVELLTAVSGTVFARMLPGEWAFFPLDPSVSAPAALANTASVQIQVLVVEA